MIYIAVTPDKYELPMAVACNTTELSRMTGIKKEYISQAISKGLNGKKQGMKFVRVREGGIYGGCS